MGLQMLDVETGNKNKKADGTYGGLDPIEDSITMIHSQPIDYKGFPIGKREILCSWESSEEDIVRKFHKVFFNKDNMWEFVPVMNNANFDLRFILRKFEKYGLSIKANNPSKKILINDNLDFLYSKPIIDIKPMLVAVNNMQFIGCGLDKLTNKQQNGKLMPQWFAEGKYQEMIDYVNQEDDAFLEAIQKLFAHLNGFNLKDE